MIGHRPDLAAAIVGRNARIAIMAVDGFTIDVPEHATLRPAEYWAGGVQSRFDTNRESDFDHNHVDTPEELREYDPG